MLDAGCGMLDAVVDPRRQRRPYAEQEAPYLPSLDQIWAEAAAIREEWSQEEMQRRDTSQRTLAFTLPMVSEQRTEQAAAEAA